MDRWIDTDIDICIYILTEDFNVPNILANKDF